MTRTIGILGMARSGRAAARLALMRGERVFVSEARDDDELRRAADEIRQRGGEVELGGNSPERLGACDLLVLSPGVPPTAPILRDPRVGRVPRISELEFAWRAISSPVIAVTGTNGKSTTTALTAHLLRTAALDAPAAGNIGIALSEVALRETAPDWVVVECSSFQLADTQEFAPQVGVVTNLSPDHLDRYPDTASYYADKARLFRNAVPDSTWVLNGDDSSVRALPGDARGARWYFRTEQPLEPGEHGAWLDGEGRLVLRFGSGETPLLPATDLRIRGRHNQENALAAALAATAAGVSAASVAEGLRTFPGLEHRLERVVERRGVEWINDSKATNVASTLVALRSVERPIVLLLGGRPKGESFATLLPEMQRVRAILAYGEAAARIEEELHAGPPVERVAGGFEDAVRRAAGIARPGDTVLLSPACASFDMFRDYEERGRRFRSLVEALDG